MAATGVLVAGMSVGLASIPSAASDDDATSTTTVDAEAAEAAAAFDILEPGETASTDNLELVANLQKQEPFNTEGAYNSDIAFQGKHAFVGNYNGFTVYDISNAKKPSIVTTVVCPGAQNDITVYGDLLFLSTDSVRSDDSCNSTTGQASNPTMWEGMKIWDISDIENPEYIKSVRTACGSHTHTLVPDGDSVLIYVSSYSPSVNNVYCQPPHDAISIIDVPLDSPTDAEVIDVPVLFPGDTGISRTTGCHDITVYPELDLAAGACMGDGILMDISDPRSPVVTERVRDIENFAFWHSATFNNDGTKVVFTDELGGGGGAICRPAFRANQGANGIYDIVDGQLEFRSYYKIPRENTARENCVAHNGTLVPVNGRDVMVQSWYQGGISVFDFTDSANPVELAWFDRGPLSAERLILGGSWSSAWYNGHIFSSDIQQGFDVLKLSEPSLQSANGVRYKEFNAQTQPSYQDAPGQSNNKGKG
jgi:hypothetical protein